MKGGRDGYDDLWAQPWQRIQDLGPMTHTRYRLVLREVAGALRPGARVLDVGCGNGTLLARLLARFPDLEVEGLEGSPIAVGAAPPALAPRIRQGDLYEELPRLAERPYDLIVCSEVLEHLPRPDEALRLIERALKPGGTVVLTVPAGRRWWSAQDEYAGHVQRFEADAFERLLVHARLQPRRVRCWGVLVGLAYDRLVSRIGPQRVAGVQPSPLSRLASRLLVQLFRLDDLVDSRFGIQLVASATKPGVPG